jgi:hypothetical protein
VLPSITTIAASLFTAYMTGERQEAAAGEHCCCFLFPNGDTGGDRTGEVVVPSLDKQADGAKARLEMVTGFLLSNASPRKRRLHVDRSSTDICTDNSHTYVSMNELSLSITP